MRIFSFADSRLISIGETRMKIRKAIRRTPMPLAVRRNIFLGQSFHKKLAKARIFRLKENVI